MSSYSKMKMKGVKQIQIRQLTFATDFAVAIAAGKLQSLRIFEAAGMILFCCVTQLIRTHFDIHLIFERYLDDMGPLRKQTFQNKGFRKEPAIESRVEEYRVHLSAGGTIVHGERVIVGLQGGKLRW